MLSFCYDGFFFFFFFHTSHNDKILIIKHVFIAVWSISSLGPLLTRLKWLRNNLSTTSLRQANVGNYMKKIFFTFDFHILPEHRRIGGRIFHCRCISTKTVVVVWGRCYCWPIYLESKPSLNLLDCGRKSRSYVHIETYYCKPQLISWR